MTLRPVVLPNGNILTIYREVVFDDLAQTNLFQLYARVSDATGQNVTAPSLLAEVLTSNSFPNADMILRNVFVGANSIDIEVLISEPGTYDAVTNTYSGVPVITFVDTDLGFDGAVLSASTTLGDPSFGTLAFSEGLNLTVLSDGTNVDYLTTNGFLAVVDSNNVPETAFAFDEPGSLSHIVEQANGDLAIAQYRPGFEFANPPTSGALEIFIIDRNATPLWTEVDSINIPLPADLYGYVLFGQGANPVDLLQLDNGNFVVAFSGYQPGATFGSVIGAGIWMTIVEPDGTVVTAPQVVDDDPNAQRVAPELFMLDGGTFALVYFEATNDATVFIQHYSSTGLLISARETEFQRNSFGLEYRDLVVLEDGSVLFVGETSDVLDPIDVTDTVPLPLITGSTGSDPLDGTAASERILGFTGDDSIRAFGGDDEIIVQTGNHTIEGGLGNDTITIESGALEINGGAGLDMVITEVSGATFANTFFFDMLAGTWRTATFFDPIDTLISIEGFTYAGPASIGVTGTRDINEVYTDLGEDTVDAFGGDDTVETGAGDDIINLGTGNDSANGGSGNDILSGNAGFDTIEGGLGNDTIIGGGQADSLFGGAGDDRIDGNIGVDQMFGGAGDDTMLGGAQNDRLFGEDGNDRMQGDGNNDRMEGGIGNDLMFGGTGFDRLLGGEGEDTLYGEAHADALLGGAGNDLADGGDGVDRLVGGNGDDTLFAGNGNDRAFGDAGADSVRGGNGNDRLFGGGGNDVIEGDADNDTIVAGSGFDTIEGGAGDDLMSGNFNADVFVFADGFGTDTITDFDALNTAERIDLSGVGAIVDFADLSANHMAQVGQNVVITDGSDIITLRNVILGTLDETDFIFS